MKGMSFLLLMGSLAFSQMSFADDIEGLTYGVSLMGNKTTVTDKFDVTGVIFASYDGYEFELEESKSLHILPTGIDIDVNGEKVRAYTDLATVQLYGMNNIEIAISAVSIDYNKFNDFSVRKEKKTALLDFTVTKFIEDGTFDYDFSFNLGVGGKIKTESVINNDALDAKYYKINKDAGFTNINISEKHYATAGVSGAVEFPFTDEISMTFYSGYQRQIGETSDKEVVYGGLDFSGLSFSGVEINPFVEVMTTNSQFEDLFRVKEKRIQFGIVIPFN